MSTEHEAVICDGDREELIRLGYQPAELRDIEQLSCRLCETARLYLARIFVRARICKKSHADVVTACQKMWQETWQFGTAERLGDPDDVTPPDIGMRNAVAFYSVYKVLGLTSPKFLF